MNKISIRGVPKKFSNGSYLILPATPNDKKLLDSFASSVTDKYVRISLAEVKANKTFDQVRTVWALIEILYEIENGAKPTDKQAAFTYMSLINRYAPRIEDPLNKIETIPLTLSQMDKGQASVFINSIMNEIMEKMGMTADKSLIVDVQDLFTEFVEWRGRQKKDPIDVDSEGNWLSVDAWCERNNASMASGSMEQLEICHIISKGKREDLRDCVWNFLRMTHHEHIEIQHKQGWQKLLSIYPHLLPRVKAAYDRAGELYPFNEEEIGNAKVVVPEEEPKSLAKQALEASDNGFYIY